MMEMAVATTIGRVPPMTVGSENDGSVVPVTVNGSETDPIVVRVVSWHLVEIAAVVALVSGSFTFYYVVGSLVDLMSLCVVLLSPILTVQGRKLRELGDLRHQHNVLRDNTSQLHEENNKLSASIGTLAVQTNKLQQVEKSLQVVATKSGHSVDRLVAMVNDNGNIQEEIIKNLQAQVLQQIMTAVVQTDHDRNFKLNAKEVDTLLFRLKHLPGVVVDEQIFRSYIKSDKGELTLGDVCGIARLLKDETNAGVRHSIAAAKDKIATSIKQKKATMFQFRPKDLLKQPKRR
jgi:hypothetical protein